MDPSNFAAFQGLHSPTATKVVTEPPPKTPPPRDVEQAPITFTGEMIGTCDTIYTCASVTEQLRRENPAVIPHPGNKKRCTQCGLRVAYFAKDIDKTDDMGNPVVDQSGATITEKHDRRYLKAEAPPPTHCVHCAPSYGYSIPTVTGKKKRHTSENLLTRPQFILLTSNPSQPQGDDNKYVLTIKKACFAYEENGKICELDDLPKGVCTLISPTATFPKFAVQVNVMYQMKKLLRPGNKPRPHYNSENLYLRLELHRWDQTNFKAQTITVTSVNTFLIRSKPHQQDPKTRIAGGLADGEGCVITNDHLVENARLKRKVRELLAENAELNKKLKTSYHTSI